MTTTVEWRPEPGLHKQLINLAQQQGRSPEAIIDEAVTAYLQLKSPQQPKQIGRGKALVNLMRGKSTANLSTDEVMQLTRKIDD